MKFLILLAAVYVFTLLFFAGAANVSNPPEENTWT